MGCIRDSILKPYTSPNIAPISSGTTPETSYVSRERTIYKYLNCPYENVHITHRHFDKY